MDNAEFVDALRLYVRDAGIEGVISRLKNPPGRSVSPKMKNLSEWYNGLSEENTSKVNTIMELVAHDVLFGVFSVLDGVRIIDEEKGQFELTYRTQKDTFILNDPSEIGLYELLNSSN
ncbi:hypothetical protein B9T25_05170 [Acinetobacter sp. ANC 4470]|uniref:hypothetical protein n=1 Tax=Acinetobacter sp. ANC 4470 TaxID=1977881 RepID=UPI000A33C582|nr:hypothetical protein [Acinetobacter sp. ANC 4470]OTG68086.1 hypothetical protein B9T25_05170 [Acinetobacter sp. ANC 4470]